MNARELRNKYTEFFLSKGSKTFPSSPLPPIDAIGNEDPSLLFTSAGMVQFKPFFFATATPPHTRLTTSQKCLRTTDIESAGDASHLTFFEMLGNFSFGDYFKSEAIEWAWEFLTEWLKLNPDRLRVTIYTEDDEAEALWKKFAKLPPERITRLEGNYWSAGPTGPCGPDSEIFYDLMPEKEFDPDWDGEGERWLEIWNLVFIMYNRTGTFVIDNKETKEGHWENVKLTPLPFNNIDTGMGLERTAAALAGFKSVYETDVFQPILAKLEEASGHSFNESEEITRAFRIIADHIRSAVFCISDGVQPSNTDKGYVLRRLIRRAALKGQRQLGFNQPFLSDIFPAVIEAMGDQYPELEEKSKFISRTLLDEETQFRTTLAEGLKRAETLELTGREAFMLYDTYGFPLEVTMELAQERGQEIDMGEYQAALQEQRIRSKSSAAGESGFVKKADVTQEMVQHLPETVFVGYNSDNSKAVILGMLVNGLAVDKAGIGDKVEIVLDQSPFYAESGGPIGDSGIISNDNFLIEISDTQKILSRWVHFGTVKNGDVKVGDIVKAEVNNSKRMGILRNHTSTHLLQAALRKILGEHVHQAGSYVSEKYLRFDFTHNKSLSEDEVAAIEKIVNEQIWKDSQVTPYVDLPIAEAKAKGAMALFGEKYGEKVRMIEIGEFSRELCGGIHVPTTAKIGLFKIVSEGSVASGVRRVEAVTGAAAFEYLSSKDKIVRDVSRILKTLPAEIIPAVEKLQLNIKTLEKKLEVQKLSGSQETADVKTVQVNDLSVIIQKSMDTDSKSAAVLVDRLYSQNPNSVIVLGASGEDKLTFVVKSPQIAVSKGVHAGNLVKLIAQAAGGSGGGRPDFAQAGAKDVSKLDEALSGVPKWLEEQIVRV